MHVCLSNTSASRWQRHATVDGNVFGGGEIATIGRGTQAKNSSTNEFDVTIYKPGETHVTMWGGHVIRDVFGGGNFATINETTDIYIDNSSDVSTEALTTSGLLDNARMKAMGLNPNTFITSDWLFNRVFGGNNKVDMAIRPTWHLTSGSVYNLYSGGLGQKKDYFGATEDIEAYVYGDVTVKLNGSTETGASNNCKVTGNIFGCNNLNGSPKGHVLVHIYRTEGYDDSHKKSAGKDNTTYDVAAVYGGGNMAAYVPNNPESTTEATEVIIEGCDETSIQYVYGGGNAASTPSTNVTVNSCYEIGSVFGGGNGKDALPNGDPNPGANVGYYAYEYYGQTGEVISGTKAPYGTGQADVSLLGGVIHSAFAGSNTKGNVRVAAVAFIDEANDQCLLHIDDIYDGGNEAYVEGNAKIKLGCITSLAVIYGGSKRADVGGDIELNITSGHFDRVFGGNNESGLIHGSITVNIEETGCHPITIGELYGCGNQADVTGSAKVVVGKE